MGLPLSLPGHKHVTERESAHYWPTSPRQYDGGGWEDCTPCSAAMLARACLNNGITKLRSDIPDIPASHIWTSKYRGTAERIRWAGGATPMGGSSLVTAIDGMKALCGMQTGDYHLWGGDFDTYIWPALTSQHAAAIQGSWRGLTSTTGKNLRRWQYNVSGIHCVFVARTSDAYDRVWWDDPLAPTGVGYIGEWVSKADLKAYYMKGLAENAGVTALVMPLLPWS